jgi:hypothetical protein
MRDSGRTIKERAMESITIRMGRSMRDTGIMILKQVLHLPLAIAQVTQGLIMQAIAKIRMTNRRKRKTALSFEIIHLLNNIYLHQLFLVFFN